MRRFFLLCVLAIAVPTASLARADLQYRVVEGAGGVPLKVVTAGNSGHPPILFIHGLGQSQYAFHHQFASNLADDYYLIGFDLRGHGASGKPWTLEAYGSSAVWAEDVAAVLEASGAQRPLIVAWSYGTLLALDYLREFGTDKAAGLLFTGSIGALLPFRASTASAEDEALAEEFMLVRQQQLSNDPRDQVAALDRMVNWLTGSPLPAEERDMLRVTAARFPAYARKAIYARSLNNRDMLPALKDMPMLIAMGSEDNAALVEDSAAMAEQNATMQFSLYEGAGHSVFLEQPERFNSELSAFAAQVLGSAPAQQSRD